MKERIASIIWDRFPSRGTDDAYGDVADKILQLVAESKPHQAHRCEDGYACCMGCPHTGHSNRFRPEAGACL